MKNSKFKIQTILIITLLIFLTAFLLSSCGYRIVGSRFLPFNSIIIKPVINNTYEPGLEERMHIALSNEFISQGIEVRSPAAEDSAGNDVVLETTITAFALGAIGAVDEIIKEQEVLMYVDLTLIGNGSTWEFNTMRSPIKITFQSTGTVSKSVAFKEAAADKACREIAKEIVSKILIEYAK